MSNFTSNFWNIVNTYNYSDGVAGGIFGTINTDPENQPKLISLSNIYSFKSNDADSNAISDPVSLQNPVVKLANIYTPVISQWNNEEASGILIGGPNYTSSPPNLVGPIWTDPIITFCEGNSPDDELCGWDLTENPFKI